LERFAAGTAASEERQEIVRHLLSGCSDCSAGLREVMGGGKRPAPEDYQPAITAALQRVLTDIGRSKQQHPATAQLLAELDRQPGSRRPTLARNLPRFWSLDLLNTLVERSFAARFEDQQATLLDARVAAEIATAIELAAERRLDSVATDGVARAWAQLGNAHRAMGNLPDADRHLQRALDLLDAQPSSPRAAAVVYDRLGALRKDQRRFAEASQLFEREVQIYRTLKDAPQLGRALLNHALCMSYDSQPGRTLEILLEASPLIDAKADPILAITAVHLAVRCYLEENQTDRALTTLLLGRELLLSERRIGLALKTQWTEGLVLAALGHTDAALQLLEQARSTYLEQQQSYNCALVSLDLACALATIGRFGEVRTLISESLPIFASLRVNREILAALMLLTRVDQQQSYQAIIRKAIARLERDPAAFEQATES
jgi:tetratricopeptide (TPR) repeat protein